MKKTPVHLLLLLAAAVCVLATRDLRSCGSCGEECMTACGTRNFKTCCFNYMRKRSDSDGVVKMDPGLRLELWLARTGSPDLYHRFLHSIAAPDEDQPDANAIASSSTLV